MRRLSPGGDDGNARRDGAGNAALSLVAGDGGGSAGIVREGRAGSEEERLAEALAHDLDGSFERLVAAYQDRLFSFAFRLSANREDAEEIAQDAFVRAYRALGTYPAERIRTMALRAWLYQIALNVARNRFRRKRHRMVSLDHALLSEDGEERSRVEPHDDPEARPDRRFEKQRARKDVATLVRELPERYRSPIVLRYVEGLPVEEVAAVLKQPVGTAKSNLHRAVNALRTALSASRSARSRALEVVR